MDNLLSVAFEAHHPEKNHHRHYELVIGRDLLDNWTVAIRYGRAGQRGHEQRFASPECEAKRAVVRDRLRRRLSAPRRIDCPYRLTAYSAAPGFDGSVWLPGASWPGSFRRLGSRLMREEKAGGGQYPCASSVLVVICLDNLDRVGHGVAVSGSEE